MVAAPKCRMAGPAFPPFIPATRESIGLLARPQKNLKSGVPSGFFGKIASLRDPIKNLNPVRVKKGRHPF